ncbi:hypothetical protein DYY67_1174 [Candidatus Nitrosotalea sp. TS]|uniref:hypothetical protein n=1 Tax=Candidatus Nitrosotalea sp. TS TaxID=2341020 RepID=UPI0014075112|nr:hypothetical protein [Candidatus Nitrosotalea sp. TS]NHI04316.1 hypothetical protein [Candidatus Nitrosotalea sp. TS]
MVKFGSIFGSKKDVSGETALDKKDLAERKALARNTGTPREVLDQLASDKDGEIRREVAHNKNVSAEILEKLSSDDEWKVRYEVARNHNTPSAIVERLCADSEWRVREGVAWNEKAPVKILEKLALDRREVRYAVLMNRHVSIKLVKQIELENEREDIERRKIEAQEPKWPRGRE